MTIQCTPEELAALMLATQERLVVHKQLTQRNKTQKSEAPSLNTDNHTFKNEIIQKLINADLPLKEALDVLKECQACIYRNTRIDAKFTDRLADALHLSWNSELAGIDEAFHKLLRENNSRDTIASVLCQKIQD